MPNPIVHLYALLQGRRVNGSQVEFDISEDWLQGRTTFGGLISTLAVQAMRDVAGAAWPDDVSLRALQTSFVGPVGVGSVQIDVQVLREGKNVRQVQARASQSGQLAAVLLAVFGASRVSSLPELKPMRPDVAKGPDELPALPFIPGLTPNFIQHIDFRWAEGGIPFSGSDLWHSRIHLKLHPGEGAPASAPAAAYANELLTVLLADAPPTPVLGRMKTPGPASSVTWALELRPVASSEGWWRVDSEAQASGQGYVNQQSTLWAPDGSLAAYGYQVVAVYA